MSDEQAVTVGVLALQGAFHEHIARFASLNTGNRSSVRVRAIAVRKPEQLATCDAIVIPGGESTAIALGLRNANMTEPVRAWIAQGRPVWGTCAGMIMLAAVATGGKRGGQELLGGLDIQVGRNGFGSQVFSFESEVDIPALGSAFPGVFIRAPVVEHLLTDAAMIDQAFGLATPNETSSTLPVSVCTPELRPHGPRPPVQVLGRLSHPPAVEPSAAPAPDAPIVAVRQGRLLATSFHPELTQDTRLHAYFVKEVVLAK